MWAIFPTCVFRADKLELPTCSFFSGVELRWAHRLEVYVPKKRVFQQLVGTVLRP